MFLLLIIYLMWTNAYILQTENTGKFFENFIWFNLCDSLTTFTFIEGLFHEISFLGLSR